MRLGLSQILANLVTKYSITFLFIPFNLNITRLHILNNWLTCVVGTLGGWGGGGGEPDPVSLPSTNVLKKYQKNKLNFNFSKYIYFYFFKKIKKNYPWSWLLWGWMVTSVISPPPGPTLPWLFTDWWDVEIVVEDESVIRSVRARPST